MHGNALIRYSMPISQSTRKAPVLMDGGPEEFRVGGAGEVTSRLAWKIGDVGCPIKTKEPETHGQWVFNPTSWGVGQLDPSRADQTDLRHCRG